MSGSAVTAYETVERGAKARRRAYARGCPSPGRAVDVSYRPCRVEHRPMSTASPVPVLELAPDLARDMSAEDAALARRHALAATVVLEPGTWQPPELASERRGHLGLLVLEGVLTRDIVIERTKCAELLGEFDLLRPWDQLSAGAESVSHQVEWEVLTRTRLAILDRRFTAVVGRWPELTAAFAERSVQRSRWLAFHLAIRCQTRVDARLVLLFWHLADRFGRVGSEGVIVPLPLTHSLLSRLVGAQRPSVTSALGGLMPETLERRPDRTWLLRGEPPRDLRHLGSSPVDLASQPAEVIPR